MKNEYKIDGDTTIIYGKFRGKVIEILIDTEDFEKVNSFRNTWHINRSTSGVMYAYGQTWSYKPKKKATHISMHRMIMNCPEDMDVDHKDGNGLNNRKYNMRNVTHQVNTFNGKSRVGKGEHVGVTWYKAGQKWRARIMIDAKEHHLGYYEDKKDAIYAVKEYRKKLGIYCRE